LTGRDILTFAPEGCGDSDFYDSKVKMENVPLIVNGENTGDLCDETALAFNELEFDYLMCEGAEGYIQTNVGGQSGEHDLEDGNKIGASYFNYLGSVDDVTESVLPFPVPDIFSDTSSDVRTFIQDQVVDVDLNPKIVVTSGEDNCITGENGGKDIVVDDSQVIGPAIDRNDDGSRETCEFDNIESFGENSREWNGLDVKCGLMKETATQSGGNLDYYSPVWRKVGDSCYKDLNIIGNYRVQEGLAQDSYDQNGLTMEGYGEGTVTTERASYNLQSFESINRVEINFANTGSDFDININGEELKVVSALQSGDPAEYIEVEGEIMDADAEWTEKEGATESGYKLVIEPSQNNLRWEWFGGSYEYPQNSNQPEIPGQINSIEFEQTGDTDSVVEINSLEISGGAAC
jgi:hypothetical protein